MTSSREQLQQLSNRDLYISIYFSQAVMLVVTILISAIFGGGVQVMIHKLTWYWSAGVWQGGSLAVIVLIVNMLLYRFLPTKWLDDGGVNDRVFRSMGTGHMIVFCAVVAVVEESLFRGVLQPLAGLWLSSISFALVHARYVKKPVLFLYTLLLSMALGWMYERTGNFFSVVFAHFLINFVLGLFLRRGARRHVIGV